MKKLEGRVIILMAVIIIPLLAVLVLYNVYSLRGLDKQIANNNLNTISLYEKQILNDIGLTQYYLANSLANDADMLGLNYASGDVNSYIYIKQIADDYTEFLSMGLDGVAALGVISDKFHAYRMVYNGKAKNDYSVFQKDSIKKFILDSIENKENIGEWKLQNIDGKYYMLRILNNNTVYACILYDFDLAEKPQDFGKYSENGLYVFATADGELISDLKEPAGLDIRMPEKQNYVITGFGSEKYMVVQKELAYCDIRQLYIYPYKGVFRYLDYMQMVLMLLSLLFALLIPIAYYYMRKTLFLPLKSLLNTMEKIKAGNLLLHLEENFSTEEFSKVKETFNSMIDTISKLRITAYEKEIQIKNTEMQYLQIQIKPHFYLNCLKNIYALAKQMEYQKIQDMILVLSDYIRGMLRNSPSFISIREEIGSVTNYITLQQMSLSNPPHCTVDVDKQLLEYKIPPLLILTFIENSVKHGVSLNKQQYITVKVSLLQDDSESFVCVSIIDNGGGFSQEVLTKLNESRDNTDQQHIGIMNIKKRIELIYKGKGTIFFSNSSGACIEIYLPYENEEVE